MITFEIPGRPIPKERPRKGRHGNFYTPKPTQEYEKWIRLAYSSVKNRPPCDDKHYWELTIKVYHKNSLDWDNIGKSVSDALQGCIWANDSQIQEAYVYMQRVTNKKLEKVLVYAQPLREIEK